MKILASSQTIKTVQALPPLYKRGIVIAVLLGGLLLLFLNWVYVSNNSDYRFRDTAIFWLGGHSLVTGYNPYVASEWFNVTTNARAALHNPIFIYPPWTAVFLTVVGWLPIGLAATLLLALSEISFVGSFGLGRQLVDWRERTDTTLYLLMALLLLFRPFGYLLNNGQITEILFALSVISLWLISKGHDYGGGFVFASLLLKPQLAVCPVLALVLWLVWTRRWKILAGGVSGIVLLALISTPLLLTSWGAWINQVKDKTSDLVICSTAWGFLRPLFVSTGQSSPGAGWYVASLGVSVLIVGIMIGTIWRLGRRGWLNSQTSLVLTVSFGFIAAETIVPYALPYDQVVLVLPFLLGYNLTLRPEIENVKLARLLRWGLVGTMVCLNYVLFLLSPYLQFNFEFFEPVAVLVLLGAVGWLLPAQNRFNTETVGA